MADTKNGKEICGEIMITTKGKVFICIREPHDWPNSKEASINHRRTHQKMAPRPDQHVMVRRREANV